MKKCEYCAKEISYHQQYCDDDCHRRANQYYENCDRFSKLFMGVNVVCAFPPDCSSSPSSKSSVRSSRAAAAPCSDSCS